MSDSPAISVLIPTHTHVDTLWFSIQSVLWQTRQDFEILVIGDGAPDRTGEIVNAYAERDSRIRYLPFPKGERHGEAHRHLALQQARGRFICYLCDDDLWFRDHLEQLCRLLEQCDIAHCMQIEVDPRSQVTSWVFDARLEPDGIERMRRSETGFGLASGGHTKEAYDRLPRGWHPAPTGINTDLHFWLQFLDQPWVRYASRKWPGLLHLSSATRAHMNSFQRTAELSKWWDMLRDPLWRERIVQSGVGLALANLHAKAQGQRPER